MGTLLVAALRVSADPVLDENVYVLTPENFDAWIETQEHAIVEFYAPWCGHCQSLAPEWAAAAAKTRKLKPAVPLAKVDAEAHASLAKRFDVSGYPTIKTFKKGVAEEYDGPREAKGIVVFAKKFAGITGSPNSVLKIQAAEDAKEIISSSAALIAIFREPVAASAMFKVFSEVASELSSFIDTPLNVSYSSSYKDDPVAAAFGIKSIPALLYFARGSAEPALMPIPRKRTEFTEDAVLTWLEGVMKLAPA